MGLPDGILHASLWAAERVSSLVSSRKSQTFLSSVGLIATTWIQQRGACRIEVIQSIVFASIRAPIPQLLVGDTKPNDMEREPFGPFRAPPARTAKKDSNSQRSVHGFCHATSSRHWCCVLVLGIQARYKGVVVWWVNYSILCVPRWATTNSIVQTWHQMYCRGQRVEQNNTSWVLTWVLITFTPHLCPSQLTISSPMQFSHNHPTMAWWR